MTRLFLLALSIFFLIISPLNSSAKDKFKQQLDSINYFLSIYDTLSPFGGDENAYERIGEVQLEIISRLRKVLDDPKIVHYKIETVFRSPLMVSKSSDDKIYFLSIDEKTGGSDRTNITLMHYRLPGGILKTEEAGSDGYGIYLLDAASHLYLLLGGHNTCNTCTSQFAELLTLDSVSYSKAPVFEYTGRYYDLTTFEFDENAKTLVYEYTSADPEDSLYGQSEEDSSLPEGMRVRYKGVFRYIKGKFVQVEDCSFIEEKK